MLNYEEEAQRCPLLKMIAVRLIWLAGRSVFRSTTTFKEVKFMQGLDKIP